MLFLMMMMMIYCVYKEQIQRIFSIILVGTDESL